MRTISFFFLMCLFVVPAAKSAEAPKNPKSVADCLLSLPDNLAGNVSRSDRKKALAQAAAGKHGQILDEKNGYVDIGGERHDFLRMKAALFPSSAGKTILGINANYFSPYPDFYEWDGTQWKDVTKAILPPKTYPKYGFMLPRHGTTITVHEVIVGDPLDTKEEVAFRMKWTGEKFVRER